MGYVALVITGIVIGKFGFRRVIRGAFVSVLVVSAIFGALCLVGSVV